MNISHLSDKELLDEYVDNEAWRSECDDKEIVAELFRRLIRQAPKSWFLKHYERIDE
jgi:hypothetical protein